MEINAKDYTLNDALNFIVVAQIKKEEIENKLKQLEKDYNKLREKQVIMGSNCDKLANHHISNIENGKEQSIVKISVMGLESQEYLLTIEFGDGHHNQNGSKANIYNIKNIKDYYRV